MVFAIDFLDDAVVEWRRTPDGVAQNRVTKYCRTLYVDGPERVLTDLEGWLRPRSGIVDVEWKQRYTSLQADDRSDVLAIDVTHATDPRRVASRIRRDVELPHHAIGTLRFYNVDLSPQFRYCIETGTDPTPETDLSTFSVQIHGTRLAGRDVSELVIGGDPVRGDEATVLEVLGSRLERADPDVLIVNAGDVVPLLYERADANDVEFELGRLPGWQQLAGKNTFESYGQVGHSAARYNVPGRVLLDTSNSFLWAQSNLAGLVDLVGRSWKPLQETAWGSIGNNLTAIQIREAFGRDVLVPWNKWEPERFKDVGTLHAADRGGFTMDPEVGMHEDVYELDFSSLYPNIMCEYNISPDTILCECHADRDDVPELGYNVCDEPGFLTDVLRPLIEDREEWKQRIRESGDDEEISDLKARSGAIKWILVSCFGYQGYRNSKFGRIECHEAINAVARDVFLNSKATLEENGWHVVHGIVDSIWVTPVGDEQTPIEEVAEEITDMVGIRLDLEAHYDWVCFVPRRGSNTGALTKYFAKVDGADEYKVRGIEARQRSTPAFVEAAQRDLLETLDANREPGPVVDRMERYVRELRTGDVDPAELVVTVRTSKRLEEYTRNTLTVAALTRSKLNGVETHPGQPIRYVVVDDDARRAERVRLPYEEIEGYDAEYYVEQLLRATESVVSPLGWDRHRIDRYRRETVDANLTAFE